MQESPSSNLVRYTKNSLCVCAHMYAHTYAGTYTQHSAAQQEFLFNQIQIQFNPIQSAF